MTLLTQLSALTDIIKNLTTPFPNPNRNQPQPHNSNTTLEHQQTSHLLQTLHYAPDYFHNLHPRLSPLPPKLQKNRPSQDLARTFDLSFNPHPHINSTQLTDTWRLAITLSPSTFPYTHAYATLSPLHTPCLLDLQLVVSTPWQTAVGGVHCHGSGKPPTGRNYAAQPDHPLFNDNNTPTPLIILPVPNSPMTTSTTLNVISSQTLAILLSLYNLPITITQESPSTPALS